MKVDDEVLMAFADGELPEAEAEALRRALAEDPALVARVALFRKTREEAAALAPEPVSAALEDRIRALARKAPPEASPEPQTRAGFAGEVVDLSSRRRRIPVLHALAAVAAALVLGFGLGQILRPAAPGAAGEVELARLLDAQPSGGRQRLGDAEISVIASFRDRSGALCREYSAEEAGLSTVAVACRGGEGWITRMTVNAGAAEGYVPASSLDVIDAWMDGAGASPAMSVEDEAQALKALGAGG